MATCPQCGASSRTDPTFSLKTVMVVENVSEVEDRLPRVQGEGTEMIKMSLGACGWSVLGWIEAGEFVAPSSAVQESLRQQ